MFVAAVLDLGFMSAVLDSKILKILGSFVHVLRNLIAIPGSACLDLLKTF